MELSEQTADDYVHNTIQRIKRARESVAAADAGNLSLSSLPNEFVGFPSPLNCHKATYASVVKKDTDLKIKKNCS